MHNEREKKTMYERKEKTKENDRHKGKLNNPSVKNVKP
jgi:hypothetical protein